MKLKNIEIEVTYRLLDSDSKEHCYTIANSINRDKQESTVYICGTHPYEEIEISNKELPFFIEALKLYEEKYLVLKTE